jgi:hypothetical protein
LAQLMAWHKCQPVEPSLQRDLAAKILYNKIGNWQQLCCQKWTHIFISCSVGSWCWWLKL